MRLLGLWFLEYAGLKTSVLSPYTTVVVCMTVSERVISRTSNPKFASFTSSSTMWCPTRTSALIPLLKFSKDWLLGAKRVNSMLELRRREKNWLFLARLINSVSPKIVRHSRIFSPTAAKINRSVLNVYTLPVANDITSWTSHWKSRNYCIVESEQILIV